MFKTLSHLFTPTVSNNYKAKTLHLSSLSVFLLIIMFSQLLLTAVARVIPGVLGIASSITAEELVQLTNNQRASQGLPALQLNQALTQAAALKASDMLVKNYWAHTSSDGFTPWAFFKQAGYYYLYAGENLARDFMDPNAVVKAWMNSATHRDNILSSRYRDIGIAVVHGTYQGQETTLVVQLFGTPVVPAVAKTETPKIQTPTVVLAQEEQTTTPPIAQLTSKLPGLSSFNLTKSLSISLTLILLTTIIIDTFLITRQKIIRLSGKSLAHLIFLGILLFLLLVIQPGLVL